MLDLPQTKKHVDASVRTYKLVQTSLAAQDLQQVCDLFLFLSTNSPGSMTKVISSSNCLHGPSWTTWTHIRIETQTITAQRWKPLHNVCFVFCFFFLVCQAVLGVSRPLTVSPLGFLMEAMSSCTQPIESGRKCVQDLSHWTSMKETEAIRLSEMPAYTAKEEIAPPSSESSNPQFIAFNLIIIS